MGAHPKSGGREVHRCRPLLRNRGSLEITPGPLLLCEETMGPGTKLAQTIGRPLADGFLLFNWFCDLFGDADGPVVVFVRAIDEGDQEPRVGNVLHDAEKPLRRDRVLRPRTAPASLMNGRVPRVALAISNCSRTICPCATPVRVAVSSS